MSSSLKISDLKNSNLKIKTKKDEYNFNLGSHRVRKLNYPKPFHYPEISDRTWYVKFRFGVSFYFIQNDKGELVTRGEWFKAAKNGQKPRTPEGASDFNYKKAKFNPIQTELLNVFAKDFLKNHKFDLIKTIQSYIEERSAITVATAPREGE